MFRIHAAARRTSGAALLATAAALLMPGALRAQEPAQVSCDEFLAPVREVKGRKVGPQSCLLQQWDLTFDGRAYNRLEPLDRNQVFADMNRNGVWDFRETPTQAWRRLGLLQQGEELTREKYVACITTAAERLRKDGFISEKTAADYVQDAAKTDLVPKERAAQTPTR